MNCTISQEKRCVRDRKQEKTQLRQFVLIALERPVLTKCIQQTGNLYSKFKSTIQQIDVELFEF